MKEWQLGEMVEVRRRLRMDGKGNREREGVWTDGRMNGGM